MGATCKGQSIPKKVLLTGPKGAGKTTCLYAWCSQMDTETVPTESFNVETVYGVKGGQLMLIWDVTDPQRRRQFYHGTDAVVYVVDASEPASLSTTRADIISILQERDLVNLPLLLVVSKQDVSGGSVTEMEKDLHIKDIIGSAKYASVGVSKDTPSNYSLALKMLCDLLYT